MALTSSTESFSVCNKTNNVNQLFYYCNIFYWQCWQILILSREEQMLLLHLVDHVGRYFVASWIRWSSWLMRFFNLPFLSFLPLLILSVINVLILLDVYRWCLEMCWCVHVPEWPLCCGLVEFFRISGSLEFWRCYAVQLLFNPLTPSGATWVQL